MNKSISFIKWTLLAIKAFLDTRESTRTVPTLYFLNLCSDASDFSAGGYLFQTVDNIERPVAFLSKACVGTRLKWATIQKQLLLFISAVRIFIIFLLIVNFRS